MRSNCLICAVSLEDDGNALEPKWWLHDIVNMLNTNRLFPLKWLISYCVNLISINYYFKKSSVPLYWSQREVQILTMLTGSGLSPGALASCFGPLSTPHPSIPLLAQQPPLLQEAGHAPCTGLCIPFPFWWTLLSETRLRAPLPPVGLYWCLSFSNCHVESDNFPCVVPIYSPLSPPSH